MGQTFDVDFDVVDGAGDVAQFEVGRLADGRGGQRLAADHHVVRVGEDLRRVRRARHRFLKKKKERKIATLFNRFHRLLLPYLLKSNLDIDRNLVLVRCLK